MKLKTYLKRIAELEAIPNHCLKGYEELSEEQKDAFSHLTCALGNFLGDMDDDPREHKSLPTLSSLRGLLAEPSDK